MKLQSYDEAFPTIVRYAGLICMLVLVGFCLAGYATRAAPGFVPVGGMILYKTVRNAAKEGENEELRNEQ